MEATDDSLPETGRATTPEATGDVAPRRRFTLDELLVGAEHLPEIARGLEGCLDGPPAGRELG